MTQPVQYALWLSGPLLQCAIGGVMLWRKLYRQYPLFLAYTASHVVRAGILFFIYQAGDREAYRQAYLFLEATDAVLSFAVVYELFDATFRAYEGIREMGWMLLKWASVILLGVAVVSAASAPGSDTVRLLKGLFALETSIAIVRGGLLFLLFLFHATLGLRWAVQAFGIALGFGLLSSIELVTFALRSRLGIETTYTLSLISSAAYICAIVVWLVAMLRLAEERPPVAPDARWDVSGWNRTLQEMLQR